MVWRRKIKMSKSLQLKRSKKRMAVKEKRRLQAYFDQDSKETMGFFNGLMFLAVLAMTSVLLFNYFPM